MASDWVSVAATFFKSLDDASSIGLGGVIVAQDPFNISADRSLSSFNQKHKFGSWMYDCRLAKIIAWRRKVRFRMFFEWMAVERRRDNWVGISLPMFAAAAWISAAGQRLAARNLVPGNRFR
jgi:hypothetical protein